VRPFLSDRAAAGVRVLQTMNIKIIAGGRELAPWRRAMRFMTRVVIVAGAWAAPLSAGPPAVEAPAPDFVLASSVGQNLRLSEFRGDVVIVNFWSIRCGRCREQLAELDAIERANRPSGLRILGVNVDSDGAAARRAAAKRKLGFPVLFDTDKLVSRLYDPRTLPMTFVIDPHGIVRHIHDGYSRGDEALVARQVAALLAE